MAIELFHSIADLDSAAVRREVVALWLEEVVRFRNVTYDEVAQDLAAHGGGATPALWDGEKLTVGRAAIIAALRGLAVATA